MSNLGAAFTVELTFGGGQPIKVHYDFDVTRGEIDLRQVMVHDQLSGIAKDILRELGATALEEIRTQVAYRHQPG